MADNLSKCNMHPMKRSVVLGYSQREGNLVTNLLHQKLQPEQDSKPVNWLRVGKFMSTTAEDGGHDSLFFSAEPFPESLECRVEGEQHTSLHYLVGAEDFSESVYSTVFASILATGIGAYFITFPLNSFAKDEMTSKRTLIEEINNAVDVIQDRATSKNKTCQVIFLGTHRDSSDVQFLLETATRELDIIYRRCVESSCLKIEVDPESTASSFVWSVNVGTTTNNNTNHLCQLSKLFKDERDEFSEDFQLDWIRAYKKITAQCRMSDILSLLKCKDICADCTDVSHLEAMWKAFNDLGWFVIHENHVFTLQYMCNVIRSLLNKNGKWTLTQKPAMAVLADRRLAMHLGGYLIAMPLLPKKEEGSISTSAAVLYLAIMVHNCIIPLSIYAFWNMIDKLMNLKTGWKYTKIEYRDYVKLLYSVYEVHLSVDRGVMEVALRKSNKVTTNGNNTVKRFAEKCQKIREELCETLNEVSPFKTESDIKCGFACEDDDPNNFRCIQVRFGNDTEYLFSCARHEHTSGPANDTPKHLVWFLSPQYLSRDSHSELQVENDIFVVPDDKDTAGSEDKAGSFTPTSASSKVDGSSNITIQNFGTMNMTGSNMGTVKDSTITAQDHVSTAGSNPERKRSPEQSGSSAKRTQPGKWSLANRCLFMSHSSKDKDTVDKIVQALRQLGINVWYDKDEIRTGHQWDKMISEVMPHMYGFICCMSEEFFDSVICYEELQAFRSARKDNSAIPKDSIFPVIVVKPSLFKGVRASWRMALPTQTHYKRWTVDNDQQLFLKDMKDFVNGSTPTPSTSPPGSQPSTGSTQAGSDNPPGPSTSGSHRKRQPSQHTDRQRRRRSSFSNVSVDNVIRNMTRKKFTTGVKNMLNKTRIELLHDDERLINDECRDRILAKLTNGEQTDAANQLIHYFKVNHNGSSLQQYCDFLVREAEKAGNAPNLLDFSDDIMEAMKEALQRQ